MPCPQAGSPLHTAWHSACLARGVRFLYLVALQVALQLPSGVRAGFQDSIQDKVFKLGADSSIVEKWWFWLIIAIIAIFFLVAAIFLWRGFRNYRRYKRELEEYDRRQSELAAARFKGGNSKALGAWAFEIDEAELARRTGRKVPAKPSFSGFQDDSAVARQKTSWV